MHQRADVAHGADVDLGARQERHGAVEVDGEAALDLVEDHAGDLFASRELLLEAGPALFALGLVAAEDGFAERVLDALQVDFDFIADLELGGLAGQAEFLDGDAAFHLQADVDDRHVLFDADDLAAYDTAFEGIVGAQRLGQHGGEVVAGRIVFSRSGLRSAHSVSCVG